MTYSSTEPNGRHNEDVIESQTPQNEHDNNQQPLPTLTSETSTKCQRCLIFCRPFFKAILSAPSCMTIGLLMVIVGLILLIGGQSLHMSSAAFVLGPLLLVMGLVILLKGCLSKMRRMGQKDSRGQAPHLTETSEERLERIERTALESSNIILPPRYSEANISNLRRQYTTQSSQIDMEYIRCRRQPEETIGEVQVNNEEHDRSPIRSLDARPIWSCDSVPDLDLAESMLAASVWKDGKHDKATDTSDLPLELDDDEEVGQPPSYCSLSLINE